MKPMWERQARDSSQGHVRSAAAAACHGLESSGCTPRFVLREGRKSGGGAVQVHQALKISSDTAYQRLSHILANGGNTFLMSEVPL